MTPAEILEAAAEGYVVPFEGIDPQTAKALNDHLVVGELAAIPISAVSPLLDVTQDLEIDDLAGLPLGTLCFTSKRGVVERNLLTRWQYVAFLSDAEVNEVHTLEYRFKRSYVIVEESRLVDYLNDYLVSAPVWGKFSHTNSGSIEPTFQPPKITALKDVCLPTQHHKEALGRYVSATNSFDRFLRLYHCLELLFDFVVFARVKALGDNLQGFAQLLSEHGRSEIDRLKAILREFCDNPTAIVNVLPESVPFIPLMTIVFHEYTKTGNPIAESAKWDAFKGAIVRGEVNAATLKKEKVIDQEVGFDKFIVDLSAYWIYRVRSSIAHSRVGEYVLEDQHTEFILRFAEPLLLCVVAQVLSSPKLRALC